MHARTGFTLLEMMIVVVIVGILSAVALPMYAQYVKKARTAETRLALSDIRQAQMMYYSVRQCYASDLSGLNWKLDGASSQPYVGKGPAFYTFATGVKGSTARTPHPDTAPEGMDYIGMFHNGDFTTDGASLAD